MDSSMRGSRRSFIVTMRELAWAVREVATVTKRRELSRVTFVLTRGIRRDGRVDNMDDADRIRWAPKVRQPKICQLYQRDAAGIVDEELIDDVGMALYERCRSILLVSNAQVECPRCGRVFHVGWGHASDDVITCPGVGCSWRTTSDQYHSSWRHRDLIGTRAAADSDGLQLARGAPGVCHGLTVSPEPP
jgi:hypothetical protein